MQISVEEVFCINKRALQIFEILNGVQLKTQ